MTPSFLTTVTDVVWSADFEPFRYTFANPALETLSGYSLEQLQAQPMLWFESIVEAEAASLATLKSQLERSGQLEREYRLKTPQGVRWVRDRLWVSRDASGRPQQIHGISSDITAHHALQVDAADARALLEQFFSYSLDGFFFMMLDEPIDWHAPGADKEALLDYAFAHQRMTRVNQSMLDQYGTTADSMIGLTPNDLYGHDIPAGRAVWRDFFDAGRLHVDTNEARFDGTSMTIEGDYVCLYDDAGRITGHFGVQREVTATRQLQNAMREAKDEAERANRMKSEFLANMSHEIRTPLNAIIGFAEILSAYYTEPRAVSYVQGILSGGRSLLALINDVLDLSKIEAGRMELNPEPCDLRALATDTMQVFRSNAERKHLSLELRYDPELPRTVSVDQTRLRQILFNLIGNAVKFTDSGFVRIAIAGTPGLDGRLELVITVSDSGIGIAVEDQLTIFESFRQAHGDTTRRFGGTGLGLAISRRLAEAMDGEISVESRLGEGASFTVRLHEVVVVEEPKLSPTVEFDPATVRFAPAVVLLVEDETSSREVIRGFLANQNIALYVAENGRDALVLAARLNPAVVLMDMFLPEIDGFTAVKRLRETRVTQRTPVIGMTTASVPSDLERATRLCDVLLRKPVTRAKLFEAMMQFLPHSVSGHLSTDTDSPEALDQEQMAALRDRFIPRWKEIDLVRSIDDIQNFAEDLLLSSFAGGTPSLVHYAEKLREACLNFDLDTVNTEFGRFTDLLIRLGGTSVQSC